MIGDKNTQKIEAGDGFSNVQINGSCTVNNGMTYLDVKQIAEDVFRYNFLLMKDEARLEADKRADEITELLLNKIKGRFPHLYNLFVAPDVQYGLYQMQKSYVLRNDEQLKAMLADVMVQRLLANDSEQGKIIFNEALDTMRMLTEKHLSILSVIFLVRYVRYQDYNTFLVFCNFMVNILDKYDDFSDELIFDHLSYAKCVIDTLGFSIIIKDFLEINRNLFPDRELDDYESIMQLIEEVPTFKALRNFWDQSPLTHYKLTSVGKVIAITYLRNMGFGIEYAIWIK
ncbi:LPO_1073/Vpar_1526 family protein [Veillonella criceti]|uniref:Uncharacterized protein n=1 Tax=Veillonella criceti TaxID=103891 RepID=A0A380NK93_9FIRM|nr:LPO_1073/Vpar_1526 family protein [Veillonella criceti]SUP42275.1 Uncharacterised protein [Veillonella criceti]